MRKSMLLAAFVCFGVGSSDALAAPPAPASAPARHAPLTACNACLWTYAEHYSSAAYEANPQWWIDYAQHCCGACVSDWRAFELISANFFIGSKEFHACVAGAVSQTE